MTALCLLSNEAFLALLVFLLAVAGVYQRQKCERGVATRAAPFVLTIIAYLGYRFWLGPHILHFRDGKAGQYAITLANIVHMSVSGIATVLPIAWHDALRSAVPGIFQGTGAIALGQAVLLAFCVSCIHTPC
jgi:hypothetical protein